MSPNTFMVVLKAGCCAQAWQIPLGGWRDLRTLGVDSSYPATDYLEAVEIQERSSGPKLEVVITGRHLGLAAACGACLGVKQEEGHGHTRVAGQCSKAQVSLAFADAAGESASSQRGGAAPAQPSASDSTALQDSEPQLPLALPASGGAAPPELERSLALPASGGAAPPERERSDTPKNQRSEPPLPLARRLSRTMSTMEHPRHQPLNSRAREVRRVASDSDTLVAPEQAQTASVDSHNDAQLMSFFREIVAKKPGTILFQDCLLEAPIPLGAQTLAQVNQGWQRSMS